MGGIRDEKGRIKKGCTLNKSGRPKNGESFAEAMREVIEEQTAVERDKKGEIVKTIKGKKVIAKAIMSIAMDAKNNANIRLTAFNTALDRAYGKPLQEIDMAADTIVHNDRFKDIKDELDKLSLEEKEAYFAICDKLNASSAES